MLIYAVADIHGKHDRIELIRETILKSAPDVLVVAGDITGLLNSGSAIAQLNDMPVPVLAVCGNSDWLGIENLIEKSPNISSLHLKKVDMNGASFAGVSGTVPIPFMSRMRFREKRVAETIEPLLKEHSVLVAHPPPRGVLDQVFGKFHAGCRCLHDIVLKRQPKLLICGHIHERTGTEFIGRTLVVNCSMGLRGAGAMIEFHHDKEIKAEML